jgi:hypothetical protein
MPWSGGKDHDAVSAGLTLPYSFGPVEGAVTGIKALKRQMYGRAGFSLSANESSTPREQLAATSDRRRGVSLPGKHHRRAQNRMMSKTTTRK